MNTMDHLWTNPQILFAQDFERATVAAIMYEPGQLSGMWNNCVNLTIRPNARDHYVELASIQAMPPYKGHGIGAVQWLCTLADRHHITLKAYPQPFGPDKEARIHTLPQWYMRRGFKPDGHVLTRLPA